MTRYAHAFGVAFQIVDDLLDVRRDESKLGKKSGSDQRKGKLTYPALYGVETSRRVRGSSRASQRGAPALWPGRLVFDGACDYVYSRQR